MKKPGCLLLLLLYFPIGSFAQRAQDSLALVALYNSTNGTNWTNNTNWLSSQPISTWYGIKLENDRVYSIYLDSNNMKGFLPSDLGKISNLRYLVLFGNQLTGGIPKEIGNLVTLEWLMLANNQFTGTIPNEIGKLSNLNTLWLYNNPLIGEFPSELWSLTNLKYFIVYDTGIGGVISPNIGNLKNLITIDLDRNQISGSIPKEIGNISTLAYLGLSGNHLTGTLPSEICNLSNLNVLELNDNQLTGSLPTEIGNLISLKWLYLNNNQLVGSIPIEINKLKLLKYIWLSENKFYSLPILTLDSVYYFTIQNNRFTFGDIEPNITIPKKSFWYSPQDSIGIKKDTICNAGQGITFHIICGGSHNQYQWYKDNNIIPSATNPLYTIPNLINNDAGSYTCVVSNTVVAGLTIYSRPIKLQVSTFTGVDDVSNPDIKVYPNPTSGIIYIEADKNLSGKSKIMVLDMHGTMVYNMDFEDVIKQELNFSQLSKGMYFLRIQNQNNNYFQKVVLR